MILEELNGKKLLRVFEWFRWKFSSQVFEFEGGLSVYIWAGSVERLITYNDLLKFLDKKELSDVFYQNDFYIKHTALEEYSRQVFGHVRDVYKKYPDVVSVDCTKCIWWKHYRSKERCTDCWALKWNSNDPQILATIDSVT